MKRGGPLKRTTALARTSSSLKRSPMKRKRPKGQPVERSDRKYLAWLRRQPCRMCGRAAPSHAHHPRTGAGLALKAPDQLAISLCFVCHHDLHALTGHFRGLPRAGLRDWEAMHGRRQRALYERAQGGSGGDSRNRPNTVDFL